MSRWFRFYADALRNPKVLRLSDKDFRLWVRLLAVASENDGHIAPLDDLKLVLNARLDHLSAGVERLISGGLIDPLADGYEPHGWAKFQYKSDTSTERVHKHREKRNVSETPPDTETEAETHTPIPAKARTGEKRAQGTRLPLDFVVPDDWKAWAAMERRWDRAAVEAEAASYVDHWHAKAGKDGVKLDWHATWRNWVRGSRRPNGTATPSALTGKAWTAEEQAEYLARLRTAEDVQAHAIRIAEPRRHATGPPGQPIGAIARSIVNQGRG